MKKIQIRAAAFAAKLCGFGVAALGFSSCDSDVCMYGTGPSTFDSEITVKGEVSTEENNPVENAEITVKYTTGHKIATGNTDSSGQYEATGKMVSTDKVRVVCTPDEKSGLEADSTDVELQLAVDKEGQLTSIIDRVDFKLKKKN